jgi:glycosyltransferase involved in cell wall biosynthesis
VSSNDRHRGNDPMISVIVPVLNEEGTLRQLVGRVEAAVSALDYSSFEIIFIDDGSSDGSWALIESLSRSYTFVRGYRLRRNFGKATALALGAEVASGTVLVTLDADLQDDPAEIPRLLAKLDEGFDLVSGWKQDRKDPISKTAASKLFNLVVRATTRIDMRDFNCGFKVAYREVYQSIPLYGELHRYIPVLAADIGYRVVEIPVMHHPRVSGCSKYGIERFVRGFLDLLTVLTISRYGHRPGHLFGGLGLLAGVIGFGILLYLSIEWLLYPDPIGNRPLLLFGIMLTLLSAQLVSFGMLAETLLFRSRPQSFASLIREEALPSNVTTIEGNLKSSSAADGRRSTGTTNSP